MSKFQAEVKESSLNLVDVCSHVLFLMTRALSHLFLSPGPETFTSFPFTYEYTES